MNTPPIPRLVLFAFLLAAAALSASAQEDAPTTPERASPTEVIEKVHQAAALLAEQGAAGLAVLQDSTSAFTWKDTYVFVVDCAADRVLANPAFPERQGGDIKQHTDYDGQPYGRALCETAQRPGGGWVEYTWPRPGSATPARKISFVRSVEGQPYQLGAGIYHDTISIDALNRLLDTP